MFSAPSEGGYPLLSPEEATRLRMPSTLFWPPSALFCRRRDRRSPEEVRTLADQRWQAKQNRDWTEADRLGRKWQRWAGLSKTADGYDLARK
ncbi:MAG: hypothetical protein ACLT38_03160 [Akkermansia sp.]